MAKGSQVSVDTRKKRQKKERGESAAVKFVREVIEPLGLAQPDDIAKPFPRRRIPRDPLEDTPAEAEEVLLEEKLGGTPEEPLNVP